MARDLNAGEYRRRLLAYGFKPQGFLGYWSLPAPQGNIQVSDLNAGPSYRAKLAYLLRAGERIRRPLSNPEKTQSLKRRAEHEHVDGTEQ
jgi:hypothetical protein